MQIKHHDDTQHAHANANQLILVIAISTPAKVVGNLLVESYH